jgi:O-antigen/teichoic acid export membrane protein
MNRLQLSRPTQETAVIGRRVLLASASNLAGKLVVIAVALALMPFLLHRLGDVQYGLWILIGSTVAYGALLDLGICDAVTKHVAEYHARGDFERANGIIAAALALYTGLGLVALVLTGALAPAFPAIFAIPPSEHHTAVVLVLLLGVQLAISIPCAVFAAILKGLQRYGLLNALNSIGQLVSAAGTVVIVLNGGSVIEVVAANVLLSIGTQAMMVVCIRRVAPELRLGWRRPRRDHVRRIAVFSSSMFAIQAASYFQLKTDEIVIGAFLSAGIVAPYAMARRLSILPQMFCDQFLKILFPLSSQLHAENDAKRLRSLYLIGSRLTLMVLIPMTGTLVTLAGPVLALWAGTDYAHYAPIVVILALAVAIDTTQWPAGLILMGTARHHRLAAALLVAGLANLALSLALVRPYGAVGVALGTLIPTAAVSLGYVLPHAMSTIGVGMYDLFKEVLLPALVPAVPMAAVLYASQWAIEEHSVAFILGTAAAATLAYGVGYLSLARDPERQLVHSVARKALRIGLLRPTHS